MSEARKYFGNWRDWGYFAEDWTDCDDSTRPADIATDDEVLLASYCQTDDRIGDAFVLFERAGALYEVCASTCSYAGLVGQWVPEETSWAAIRMRPMVYFALHHEDDMVRRLHELLAAHGGEGT